MQKGNIHYPKVIESAVLDAYSHYPELKANTIHFKFVKDFGPSMMQAQPVIGSLIKDKGRREYIIRMKPYLMVEGDSVPIYRIPHQVLVGWLGHELGHVFDYRDRSSINLLWLGIRYSLSKKAVLDAEKAADVFALRHGLTEEILAVKNFILADGRFPNWYQERITKYYLTPDDILQIARNEGITTDDFLEDEQ